MVYTYYDCTNVEQLFIDDGEEPLELNYGEFKDCPLKYVYFGRKVSIDGYRYFPFYFCKEGIIEVSFGSNITEIPDYISDFSNLETMILLNPTPPSVSSYCFNNSHYINLNVFVPKGSLETYLQADVWKNFWGLQERDFTGIEDVVTDGNRNNAAIYDMQGRRLNAPKTGLNIINGKKVMIRK